MSSQFPHYDWGNSTNPNPPIQPNYGGVNHGGLPQHNWQNQFSNSYQQPNVNNNIGGKQISSPPASQPSSYGSNPYGHQQQPHPPAASYNNPPPPQFNQPMFTSPSYQPAPSIAQPAAPPPSIATFSLPTASEDPWSWGVEDSSSDSPSNSATNNNWNAQPPPRPPATDSPLMSGATADFHGRPPTGLSPAPSIGQWNSRPPPTQPPQQVSPAAEWSSRPPSQPPQATSSPVALGRAHSSGLVGSESPTKFRTSPAPKPSPQVMNPMQRYFQSSVPSYSSYDEVETSQEPRRDGPQAAEIIHRPTDSPHSFSIESSSAAPNVTSETSNQPLTARALMEFQKEGYENGPVPHRFGTEGLQSQWSIESQMSQETISDDVSPSLAGGSDADGWQDGWMEPRQQTSRNVPVDRYPNQRQEAEHPPNDLQQVPRPDLSLRDSDISARFASINLTDAAENREVLSQDQRASLSTLGPELTETASMHQNGFKHVRRDLGYGAESLRETGHASGDGSATPSAPPSIPADHPPPPMGFKPSSGNRRPGHQNKPAEPFSAAPHPDLHSPIPDPFRHPDLPQGLPPTSTAPRPRHSYATSSRPSEDLPVPRPSEPNIAHTLGEEKSLRPKPPQKLSTNEESVNLETIPDNKERPDLDVRASTFSPPQNIWRSSGPDNQEVTSRGDRNQYLETAQLAEQDTSLPIDLSLEPEVESLPPPGLSRHVTGEVDGRVDDNISLPPSGLDRMVPGQITVEDRTGPPTSLATPPLAGLHRMVVGQPTEEHRMIPGESSSPRNQVQLPPDQSQDSRQRTSEPRMVTGESSFADGLPSSPAVGRDARVVPGVGREDPPPASLPMSSPVGLRASLSPSPQPQSRSQPQAERSETIGSDNVENYSNNPPDQPTKASKRHEKKQYDEDLSSDDKNSSRRQRDEDFSVDSEEYSSGERRRVEGGRRQYRDSRDRENSRAGDRRRVDGERRRSRDHGDRDEPRQSERRRGGGDQLYNEHSEGDESPTDERRRVDADKRRYRGQRERQDSWGEERRRADDDKRRYRDNRRKPRDSEFSDDERGPGPSERGSRDRNDERRDKNRQRGYERERDRNRDREADRRQNRRRDYEDTDDYYDQRSERSRKDGVYKHRGAPSRNSDRDSQYRSSSRRQDEVDNQYPQGNAYNYNQAMAYYYYQQYYENLRHTNPAMYAEYYKKYYAASQQGTYSEDRASVHSGRSSANEELRDRDSKENMKSIKNLTPVHTSHLTHIKTEPRSGRSIDTTAMIEEQQQRLTPSKFTTAHVKGVLSHGQLIKIVANYPIDGQPALIELHENLNCFQTAKDQLQDFPGPLVKGVSHKNNVVRYCKQKIKDADSNPNLFDKDSYKLIWELLILLLRQNGTIVGTDIAELLMAQRPLEQPVPSPATSHHSINEIPGQQSLREEEVTNKFRDLLIYGNTKEALEWAMKHGLWGHALFLASKVDQRTYASVMTRFANGLPMTDPLQTLYQLMSGRQPASVTLCSDERWGDWRPHLAMILSNPSSRPEIDHRSITTLGDTLASRGDLHAAHFCYLMAQMEFGSYAHKSSKIVLIGSSHSLPFYQFATNEAIFATEIFEFACNLADADFVLHHLQVYKLLTAKRLAEIGMTQEAVHYCEVIANTIMKNPSLYPPRFVQEVYDLGDMLKYSDPLFTSSDNNDGDPAWLQQLVPVLSDFQSGVLQHHANFGGSLSNLTTYSEPDGQPSLPLDTAETPSWHQPELPKPPTQQQPQMFQPQSVPQWNPPELQQQQPQQQQQTSSLQSLPPMSQPLSSFEPQRSEVPNMSANVAEPSSYWTPPTANQWPPPSDDSPQSGPAAGSQPVESMSTPNYYDGNRSEAAPTISLPGSTPRRPRTTSQSSESQPRPQTSQPGGKEKEPPTAQQQQGWFGGILNKLTLRPKNQMYLPDDKNPTIVWDESRKKWVDQNSNGDDGNDTLPPPPKAVPRAAPSLPNAAPPSGGMSMPTSNPLSKPPTQGYRIARGTSLRSNYVDLMNPGGQASMPSVVPPPDLYPSLTSPNLMQPAPVESSENGMVQGNPPFGAQENREIPSQGLSRWSSTSSLSKEVQRYMHTSRPPPRPTPLQVSAPLGHRNDLPPPPQWTNGAVGGTLPRAKRSFI